MSIDATIALATSAKTGSTCTANINGADTTIEVARDLTVASGDSLVVVKFQNRARWVATARLGLSAPPVSPEDTPIAVPPPSVPAKGKKTIQPVETRTRRGSKWRTDDDDVRQGAWSGEPNNLGAVFYGNRVTSLSGKTVTSASIHVRRPDRGGANAAQSTTMRLMTNKTRPGGAVTLTSTTAGPSLRRGQTDTSFAIPTSWAQALVDGTAGGIAFYDAGGSPYVIFAGRSDYSPAFTLTINWTG